MSDGRYSQPFDPSLLFCDKDGGGAPPVYLFRLKEGDTRIRSSDQMPLIVADRNVCLPPSYNGKAFENVVRASRSEKVGKLWLWAWLRCEYERSLPADEGGYSDEFSLSDFIEKCISSDMKRKYRLPAFLFGLINEVEKVLCEAVDLGVLSVDLPASVAKVTPDVLNKYMNALFAATDARQQWKVASAFEDSLVKRKGGYD